MADDAIESKIEQAERALQEAETEFGPKHEAVAEVLNNYAELLRSNKIRLLDAANMAARAHAIVTGDSRREMQGIGPKPTNAKLMSQTENRIRAAQTANRLRALDAQKTTGGGSDPAEVAVVKVTGSTNFENLLADQSIALNGTIQTAWAKLVDWENMPTWDILMESVQFDGPIQAGSVGQLKTKAGPKVALRVTSYSPPISYTDEFNVLGSRFIFHHELVETGPQTLIMRFTVEAGGLLASVMKNGLAKDFADKLPIVMNNFKRQYEAP